MRADPSRRTLLRSAGVVAAMAATSLAAPRAVAAGGPATVTNGDWFRFAQAQLRRLDPASSAYPQVHGIAGLGYASLHGWRDHRVRDALAWLDEHRTGTGGWGLPVEMPPRPVTTTYSITTARHVGDLLVGAAAQGVVDVDYLAPAVFSPCSKRPQWTTEEDSRTATIRTT